MLFACLYMAFQLFSHEARKPRPRYAKAREAETSLLIYTIYSRMSILWGNTYVVSLHLCTCSILGLVYERLDTRGGMYVWPVLNYTHIAFSPPFISFPFPFPSISPSSPLSLSLGGNPRPGCSSSSPVHLYQLHPLTLCHHAPAAVPLHAGGQVSLPLVWRWISYQYSMHKPACTCLQGNVS